MKDLQDIIEKAWEDRSLLNQQATIDAIREVVGLCDQGILRCAEPYRKRLEGKPMGKKRSGFVFPNTKNGNS